MKPVVFLLLVATTLIVAAALLPGWALLPYALAAAAIYLWAVDLTLRNKEGKQ